MHRKSLQMWVSGMTLCAVAGLSGAAIGISGSPQNAIERTAGPYDLTCEGLERPIAVNTLFPRLSWKLPEEWKSQSAYELQVGTDSLALAQGGATDLWHSGKIDSPQSVNVVYGGDALIPGIQAYWRVRVWDGNGVASEWSRVGRFGVGYIDGNEMPGDFIGGAVGESSSEPVKYLMIPNRVYGAMANHRYNRDPYLDGIDYPVEYYGYSMVDKIYWDSDNIDHVEVYLNVKTSPDAEVGKDYRLEILSGDEGDSYAKYVNNEAGYNYSVNSDNDLFYNGTFESNDKGKYTPGGPYQAGDEDKYDASLIKELGPSIRQTFKGNFSTIKVTGAGRVDDVTEEGGDAPVEYFDLKGIRVDNPRNGIYVRRCGNKVEKVVIR